MFKKNFYKTACVLLIFSGVTTQGISQHISIDTKAIETLVREWDFANNNRSVESFQNVYHDTVLFYTQTLPGWKAIALKQAFFKEKPYFQQRISTAITYTPFTSGVTRCDFTKEVLEKSVWKAYPSYLLVSYENARYWIVGESEYGKDRTLQYQLDLGKPMTFENASDLHLRDSLLTVQSFDDSGVTTWAGQNLPGIEALDTLMQSIDPLILFPQLSGMGTIIIPKAYVFILIGFLTFGGLMIFVAESVKIGRIRPGVVLQKRDEADEVIADFKMQSVFESFVITLFDPLYFRHKRPKSERVLAGNATESSTGPDLEFDFNYKDTQARFSIKCKYYNERVTNQIRLFSPRRHHALRDFAEGRETPLYFILGFGGTPDDPKELFLIPANAMKHEVINKVALKPYSKSGMFFYNTKLGRLQ